MKTLRSGRVLRSSDCRRRCLRGHRVRTSLRLISLAREEGSLDDIFAIPGNGAAIKACRQMQLPSPDGASISASRVQLRRLRGK